MDAIFTRLRGAVNRSLLVNAGSMVGTTVITAGLGFVYWWLAARQFPQEAVGFASALISAMGLLGSVGMLGLGTLLIGELPRQPARRGALIATALLVSGALSALLGALFALVAPMVSPEFGRLAGGLAPVALFALGVGLTALTLVLDQALVGLLRGGLQLWRNTIFAVVKLAALLLAGAWASGGGMAIYNTWTVGNLISLAGVGAIAAALGLRVRAHRPDWELLRRLPGAALGHHALNLALQLPGLGLPVVVTALLSATLNASFAMAWLSLHLVFAIPYTLTTVLYAAGAADRTTFPQKIRLTLGVALTLGLLSNIVLWAGADLIMGVFGRSYAEQAAWTLRIMGLAVFPLIVKDHYVAIQRVREQIPRTAALATLGSALELGLAALGASQGGLLGLSAGFVVAVALEAAFMVRTVYRSAAVSATRRQPADESSLVALEHA